MKVRILNWFFGHAQRHLSDDLLRMRIELFFPNEKWKKSNEKEQNKKIENKE